MKRIVISAGLAAFLALSAAGQAAEISASISGTMDPATPFSDAGIVGGGFSSSEELTATGSVPQFNIFGAVLRSYSIKGSLVLRSDGTITIQADNTAAGGQVEAGGVSDSCPDSSIFGSIHCFEAVASNNFSIDYFSDFGINGLIGTGSVPVSGKGVVTMTGGCFAGTNPDGDCSQVLWEHWGSAVLEGLRVEWGYCTTPGEEGCPDLVLGVNSPRQGDAAVPEPITLALFGAGLTGLAVSRRIRPKRRS